ncbi:hypothetical protein QN277_015686 [Acacia crassicarpa]|uniref:Uncharacterized protein n=1 Tax=Acacia crassicarpa TaxID=499986 RepID=A0AAE1MTM6_9FABA|nr:hypothetical protein QN277_015686 [Acacia crassicarpa]
MGSSPDALNSQRILFQRRSQVGQAEGKSEQIVPYIEVGVGFQASLTAELILSFGNNFRGICRASDLLELSKLQRARNIFHSIYLVGHSPILFSSS